MNNNIKTILYAIGIIVVIYLAIVYVIPFLFKVLSTIIVWGLIIVAVIFIIGFFMKLFKK